MGNWSVAHNKHSRLQFLNSKIKLCKVQPTFADNDANCFVISNQCQNCGHTTIDITISW